MKQRAFTILIACAILLTALSVNAFAIREWNGSGGSTARKIADVIESIPLKDDGPAATPPSVSDDPAGPPVVLPYTDVRPGAWYEEDLKYLYSKGLMSGITRTEFGPDEPATRGMLVAMLYRLDGEPPVTDNHTFEDVPADSYYADAVSWAVSNSIVKGVAGGGFAPKNALTRQELASILYRFSIYKGYSVSGRGSLSNYEDADQVSEYAVDAMAWANRVGLIKGVTQTTLDPKGVAKRSGVAAIMHRFCETVIR